MQTEVSWQYYIEIQPCHTPSGTRYSARLPQQTLKVPEVNTGSGSSQTNLTVDFVTFPCSQHVFKVTFEALSIVFKRISFYRALLFLAVCIQKGVSKGVEQFARRKYIHMGKTNFGMSLLSLSTKRA